MVAELLWVIPFIVHLACIALLPLIKKEWWEKNFLFVSLGLGAVTLFHYLVQLHRTDIIFHTAAEYFSFICLIGSLFVVSGGIHIQVKGEAKPWINCVYLFIAALLTNLIGTTGASMLLVRPWIRMNKYRITAYHIVFFIFIVSNVGGALTPIGDPPLFLGYLKGVPFFWVMRNVWPIWLAAVTALITIFFVIDSRNFKKAPLAVRQKETFHEEWKFEGLRNLFFLGLILGAVFINHPHFLREGLMLAAALFSYLFTPKHIHEKNDFSFAPVREVAILFLGIFATMIPALEWLEKYASQIGISTPGQFYWGSGILSSVLDNAPTYLNFFSAAQGLFGPQLLTSHPAYIKAISVGSVFFGAVTYIGNGPNFLVKAIADQSKVATPSFFGYFFKYSLPILVPIFFVIWFIFFKSA